MSLNYKVKEIVKLVRSGSHGTTDVLEMFGYNVDKLMNLTNKELDTILVSMANTMTELAKTSNIDLRKN